MVDRDPPSVRLIQATLSDESWTMQVAGTAADAIRSATAFQPDVILLELALPDMSGLELIRLLKSDSSTADAAIVVATASTRPQSERLAFEAGCQEYLRKPLDVLSLPGRLLAVAEKKLESSGATSKGAQ